MPAVVAYGHRRGVEMGFYLNGCGCNEKVEREINYAGDVRATVKWGFDAAKVDSCGAQKNMTKYYELFNASGVAIELENCHQGQNITVRPIAPEGTCNGVSGLPTPCSS